MSPSWGWHAGTLSRVPNASNSQPPLIRQWGPGEAIINFNVTSAMDAYRDALCTSASRPVIYRSVALVSMQRHAKTNCPRPVSFAWSTTATADQNKHYGTYTMVSGRPPPQHSVIVHCAISHNSCFYSQLMRASWTVSLLASFTFHPTDGPSDSFLPPPFSFWFILISRN